MNDAIDAAPSDPGSRRPYLILTLVIGVLVALASYFLFAWDLTTGHRGLVALDIYGYYYPNMLYLLHSLADGGRGLLWNAWQDCGQPFFGISSTGILYPLNLPFLFVGPDRALRAVIVLHLVVGGVGAYLLARELGASRLAAACGAMAFELGCSMLDLATWTPLVSAAYAWLPTILLFCERGLRQPSPVNGVGLAVAAAIALLPGFPQIVLFAYQLVAVRILWEIATRRGPHKVAGVLTVGLGLTLAPLLAAVQLLPGLEMARTSVRNMVLSADEIAPGGFMTWSSFRTAFGIRMDIFNPFVVLPAVVAAASLGATRTRRRALPYALAGALFLILAFGPATPLFDLYLRLPGNGFFREPRRFLWMADFCLAVLTALGVDALLTAHDGPVFRRVAPLGLVLLALFGLDWLSPSGLRPGEWLLAGLLVAGASTAVLGARWLRTSAAMVTVAIGANLAAFPLIGLVSPRVNAWGLRPITLRRLVRSGEDLRAAAPVFRALRERMTPQDRVYPLYVGLDPSFVYKTGVLFGVANVRDYEPQPSRRYAAYLIMMRTGEELRSLNLYYTELAGMMPPGLFRRRLLDLAAGRYLVTDTKADTAQSALSPPPDLLAAEGQYRAYENPSALPRAFYVPRLEIVANGDDLLHRLAFGSDDLRRIAFVEEPPPSGFIGANGSIDEGRVEFLRNDPEHIVLRVSAPARGFLHLADQYAPGWSASVNGAPSPIMRGNYLFRLVEVPAGDSVVEFRYRPASVMIGAVVSVISVFAAAVTLLVYLLGGRGSVRAAARRSRADRRPD